MDDSKVLSWETIEHAYYEKTADWYWIIGIVGAVAIFLSFLFGNILLAIIFLIGTASIMLHGSQEPDTVTVRLGPQNVRIGKMVYPYSELISFSVDEDDDPVMLYLSTKSVVFSQISVPIEDVPVDLIRDYLHDHLDETYHKESFVEGMIHFLGF